MATSLPTPASTPPPPPATGPSISVEINAATRKQHTVLNRLIIERLALALPPHASNPALLGQGLAQYAAIFFAFEDAWSALEASPEKRETGDEHKDAVLAWLRALWPAGLERSSRLRRDLEHIQSVTGAALSDLEPRRITPAGHVFEERPHLLVAYAWVLYMAIFSGGRWIRQQLANAGPEFWQAPNEPLSADKNSQPACNVPGFSFLSFDGDEDGEGLKRHFKAKLADAEGLLSLWERREVVEEAQKLFEHCIGLMHELDRMVWQEKVRRFLVVPLLVVLAVLVTLWIYSFLR